MCMRTVPSTFQKSDRKTVRQPHRQLYEPPIRFYFAGDFLEFILKNFNAFVLFGFGLLRGRFRSRQSFRKKSGSTYQYVPKK